MFDRDVADKVVSSNVETALSKLKDVCIKAGYKINESLAKGERLGVTDLSHGLALEFQMKFVTCYSAISLYIESRNDIEVKKGKHGGIQLKGT